VQGRLDVDFERDVAGFCGSRGSETLGTENYRREAKMTARAGNPKPVELILWGSDETGPRVALKQRISLKYD
jgi:hypothetical protein